MALPPIASFVENANEEQGDLEIEMPGSSVIQEDILPEGLDIQIEEDGGVVIDFDPFAGYLYEQTGIKERNVQKLLQHHSSKHSSLS